MIEVPEETTHWRILRHTGGRPKPIPGHDQQPARFGLDITPDDLLDMCGPGNYRVEALDQYGNRLELVTTLTIGHEDRQALPEEVPVAFPPRNYASSDLRIAMETIAHMSRTHTDSLRALAMAQADWIKMLAMQKALPRNGYVLPASVNDEGLRNGVDSDDDDEQDDAKPSWLAALEPVVPALVSSLVPKLRNVNLASVLDWRKAADSAKPANTENEVCATAHVLRVRSRLNASEQRLFDEVLRDDAASDLIALLVSRSEDDAVEYLRRQFTKPVRTFANQLAAVTELLTPEEQTLVMTYLPSLPAEQIQSLQAQLVAMTPTEAVLLIRTMLASKKASS